MAAALLLRLEALNGDLDYAAKAQETLETFAGVVEHFGLYAASYGLALQRLVQRAGAGVRHRRRCEARRLETAALARYAVNKSVVRLRREQSRRCRRRWRRPCRICRTARRSCGELCGDLQR